MKKPQHPTRPSAATTRRFNRKGIQALAQWYNHKAALTGDQRKLQKTGLRLFEQLVNRCSFLLGIQLRDIRFIADETACAVDEQTLCITAGLNQLVFFNPHCDYVVKFSFTLTKELNAGQPPGVTDDVWAAFPTHSAIQIKNEHRRSMKCLPQSDRRLLDPHAANKLPARVVTLTSLKHDEVSQLTFDHVKYGDTALPLLLQCRGNQDWTSIPPAEIDRLLLECYQRMFRATGRIVIDGILKNFVLLGEGENQRLVCCDPDQNRRSHYDAGYETDNEAVDDISTMAMQAHTLPELMAELHKQNLTRSAKWMEGAYALTFYPAAAAATEVTREKLLAPDFASVSLAPEQRAAKKRKPKAKPSAASLSILAQRTNPGKKERKRYRSGGCGSASSAAASPQLKENTNVGPEALNWSIDF